MNKINHKYIIAFVFLILVWIDVKSQTLLTERAWADSLYNAMSDDERIGQLFMVRAFSKKDRKETAKIIGQIREHHIGGICFFQGSPREEARITNMYQDESKIPLMTAIDGEWGLGMRFKDQTISFPRQLMLGAIQDNNLIYEMGKEVARHCQRIGLHVNFAPVADVNNNPDNPVINDRSYGEDMYNVAAKSYSYMRGMQDQGILACAKHFPGHGDTDVDSHVDLPIIAHDMQRLDSLELMPFRALSKYGIKSMMAAHLHVPSIDNRTNRPTSLSKTALTDILRKDIGFDGIIFTDAMEMKGVTKHFKTGQAEAEALQAGNDMIVLSEDLSKSIKSIKEYISDGRIEMTQVEASVKRILLEKYRLGLYQKPEKLSLENISEDLNSKESLALKSRLIEEALTLVNDRETQIPITTPAQKIIMTLTIGSTTQTPFQSRINSYSNAKHYFSSKQVDEVKAKALDANFESASHIIVSFHDMSKYANKNFGIDQSAVQYVRGLAKRKRVIVTLFGSPYALRYFEDMDPILVAYNEDEMTQDLAAQALFGANRISGKLPVSGSNSFPFGMGVYRESNGSLGYSTPERVGMISDSLIHIDKLVAELIKRNAAPGCQVFVAKDGKVIFDKSYGHFTQSKKRKVRNSDIYDVASVTKIMASTLSLMKLYDEGLFDPSNKLRTYLPEADTCNKGEICVNDMLAHQGKLVGWIPFYKKTMTETKYPQPIN
ncbi:serine hydrolase, partial [Saprospiraceae bacterium]|nr:serine hydrolase [Saprospiraceae bacterium]